MSTPTIPAAIEARQAALAMVRDAEAAGDEVALICAESNAVGAMFNLVQARQHARLVDESRKAPAEWDADWSCDTPLWDEDDDRLTMIVQGVEAARTRTEQGVFVPEVEPEEPVEPVAVTPQRPSSQRILDRMREELRAPNERTPKVKRKDMKGERCRVHACTRRAKPDGLCVVHGERDTCRLDGCEAPATGPGTACYYHRGLGPEVTVAPVRRERRPDGKCAHDECPRSARKAPRAFCQACENAGRFAGVCAAEPCEAAIKIGRYCGRHRAFAAAA